MRILVIDDDADIRALLKMNLESESFVVDTAGDGAEGSYLGRTNDYDLIILDNVMPRKNGHDVCREIRNSGKHTPILMLSIQSEIEDKVDVLDIGADDYVTKPFSYRELRSRIRALLRCPKPIVPSVLKVSDLVIDSARQKVFCKKKEVYLTRKEFALAEYLVRSGGNVVSRGMLMEHVWDDSVDPFSNTVEVHIRNLRKKLDGPLKKKIIQTVPGRGYKIEPSGKAIFD